MTKHYLDCLFAPRAVAVIGASDKPGSVGGRVLRNVLDGGFAGPVYPINPKHDKVAGRRCYPYPAHLTTHVQLADGTDVTIRPIRPEDAKIEETFVRDLSPRAKYLRFMQALTELTPEMLMRFTQIDYDTEMALIAVTGVPGQEIEIAVARYGTDGESCEFAIAVADEWRGKGLGTRLLSLLTEHARQRGLKRMEGDVLAENQPMLTLARKLGFASHPSADTGNVYIAKELLV